MASAGIKPALLPKDYIVADEGLYFAVVLAAAAGRPVYCSLRYVDRPGKRPLKLNTAQANELLAGTCPRFIGFSDILGAGAIMVPAKDIIKVYRPREALQRIAETTSGDKLKQTAIRIAEHLVENNIDPGMLGITGSLMLGFHNEKSDIDFVVYDLVEFQKVRRVIREAIDAGIFNALDQTTWLEAYKRRGCALDFNTYLKHELRKFNKFMLGGTKIDVSYVPPDFREEYKAPLRKLGLETITAKVIDDSRVFDYPASYIIDGDDINRILCYTATYIGQAFNDEIIEATGMIERDAEGRRYMVVGTSREAPDEYIKVTKFCG
jgi:predicted nucleotidyltransferase